MRILHLLFRQEAVSVVSIGIHQNRSQEQGYGFSAVFLGIKRMFKHMIGSDNQIHNTYGFSAFSHNNLLLRFMYSIHNREHLHTVHYGSEL
jgi:hypothetical protein